MEYFLAIKRNMYKGPMVMDKGWELTEEAMRGWAGQGRAMEEN